LKTLADGTAQGRQSFDAGSELPRRDAGLDIKGCQAVAAVAAVVVSALIAEVADDRDDGAFAVGVVAGGVLTVNTGYAGAFVAVFFCASRC
jgi:hypothetical protein